MMQCERFDFSEAATGGVLRNFVKFTGKHLCQSLFLIKILRVELTKCFVSKPFRIVTVKRQLNVFKTAKGNKFRQII